MTEDIRNAPRAKTGGLSRLDPSTTHKFTDPPAKRINDGEDLSFFLASKAYADIVTFVLQLNAAMFPRRISSSVVQAWPTDSLHIRLSPQVMRIRVLVQTLQSMTRDAPPDRGPRRFGNAAFRKWYDMLKNRVPELLQQAMPEDIWKTVGTKEDRKGLEAELTEYLLGAFGSAERLDYGTGHELSFVAFLGCLWKLNGFASSQDGSEERGIVVGIIEPYLILIRHLITIYTLEPAGSHGVWGLDDHSFVPYIFGSAQFAPPVANEKTDFSSEGSLDSAPPPTVAGDPQQVKRWRIHNMYCSALGFVFDVKNGPFWEHSPTLYNISGIKDGWAKINKGLVKMYNVEVLSKFPVVQHFRFGTLFRWERDPEAVTVAPSLHGKSQPSSVQANGGLGATSAYMPRPGGGISAMPPPSLSGPSGRPVPPAAAAPPWDRKLPSPPVTVHARRPEPAAAAQSGPSENETRTTRPQNPEPRSPAPTSGS